MYYLNSPKYIINCYHMSGVVMVTGTYEELMLGVKGKKQKRGSRAKASKKGGSKMVEDDIMELGYGETN